MTKEEYEVEEYVLPKKWDRVRHESLKSLLDKIEKEEKDKKEQLYLLMAMVQKTHEIVMSSMKDGGFEIVGSSTIEENKKED